MRPKLKTRTALALVFGAFLVLYGALGSASWELGKKRQWLEADVALLARGVRGDAPDTGSLLAELKSARAKAEEGADLFPERLRPSQALQTMLSLAARKRVGVTAVREKAPIRKVIGEHVYYASPFSLNAQGQLESLLAFVAAMERGEGGPLVLQEVMLNRKGEVYLISLDLAFYTRSRTETVPKPDAPAPEGPGGSKGRAAQ